MNRLAGLYEVTKQLETILDQEITSANREKIIEQVNQLIEARGVHMDALTQPYNEAEQVTGKAIVVLNASIQNKMQILFEGLKEEMRQVQQQKKVNQSYTNPYKNTPSINGMFMDSKN